ncbi:uncharacterized protein LOC127086620 [Lathyrus oleraceus]|uniref:uncharacterized protein LOC127086620 n=1 Tax=Pisum sativum TaxID=3888 RepID=UPI0021D2B682|nr:uncharacterized protein LOC127086620 [Pisum sativum]XP_050883363.1 uncharacterized protein LOC127086620 [Pisum sativum]XP_050883364.1 uncharacterized protein LOC127086620 [Pisum sativum]
MVFTDNDFNLKVLRSLTREWKPKVTRIPENKILFTMTLISLFGKLQEHELELGRLEKHENQEKKSKGITLKDDTKEEQENDASEEDENFMLLVKRLDKLFVCNEKSLNYAKRTKFFRKNDSSTSTPNITCYEYGKQRHIKMNYPKLTKKNDFKSRKESKLKRAYIAWEDNEISSSSDSKTEEYENLALMESHYSDDEDEEVSNDYSIYDNDAQGSIDEFLNECKILYNTVSKQKKQILSLEEKIDTIESYFEVEK